MNDNFANEKKFDNWRNLQLQNKMRSEYIKCSKKYTRSLVSTITNFSNVEITKYENSCYRNSVMVIMNNQIHSHLSS